MTWTKILSLAAAGLLWVAAGVAALFGMWLPLLVLMGASGLVVAAFAAPVLWQRLQASQSPDR